MNNDHNKLHVIPASAAPGYRVIWIGGTVMDVLAWQIESGLFGVDLDTLTPIPITISGPVEDEVNAGVLMPNGQVYYNGALLADVQAFIVAHSKRTGGGRFIELFSRKKNTYQVSLVGGELAESLTPIFAASDEEAVTEARRLYICPVLLCNNPAED